MSAPQFLTDDANLAELVSHMPEEDQARFNNYGHFRIEAVFIERVFIVYKPTGLLSNKQHREPEILTTVRVVNFSVDPREGCQAVLRNEATGEETTLTHVPRKVFGYPVYASLPSRLSLRWDCRIVNGKPWRSLSFALLLKTKNKADFYSQGNVYAETPNKFRQLYPSVTGAFKF
jgi:hypothetical protein